MSGVNLQQKVEWLEKTVAGILEIVPVVEALRSKWSALDQEIKPGLMWSDLLKFQADLRRSFKRR